MKIKFIKRITTLFIITVMIFSSCITVNADAIKERPIVYTALGDSISTGYKLDNTKDSYVSLFGQYLCTTPVNLGQNGLDSAGLLKKLNNDQKVIDQIKKSDLITISMGGNDLLPIFMGLQPTSLSTLIDAVKKIQGTALQKKFKTSVERFNQNWANIISRIKKLSPNAVIIVTTLINPYRGIVVNVPWILNFDLGAYSDNYVSQINNVIIKNASGNYFLADSYTMFKQNKNEKLTNANLSKFYFDPHPNITGHNLIFQCHKSVKIDFNHNAVAIDGPDKITIPADANNSCADYLAKPILTCFTSNINNTSTVYQIEDAGSTNAEVDSSSGKLIVKNPGTVKIKAVTTSSQTNISAEEVKTIHVEKAQSQIQIIKYKNYILQIMIVAAALLLVIIILILYKIFKSHKK